MSKAIKQALEAITDLAEEAYETTNGNPEELMNVGRVFSAAGVILMQAAGSGMTKAEVLEAVLQIRMRLAQQPTTPRPTNRIVVPGHGNSSRPGGRRRGR